MGKPPGQNSPVSASSPNTGSRVCSPERPKSKGQPRKERLFSSSQAGLKQSRKALSPDAEVGNERPRHRDAGSLSQSGGGREARRALWFPYKQAPSLQSLCCLRLYKPVLEAAGQRARSRVIWSLPCLGGRHQVESSSFDSQGCGGYHLPCSWRR